jgi:methylglutaconyl-CoA hydratase
MTTPLDVGQRGPTVEIRMTRPDRRNAFDAGLIAALEAAFREAPERPDARVIVLSGEGPAFSAGADLHWMRSSLELSESENRADANRLVAMLATIAECPLPVLARVHGAALGGGAGLVCAADIAIAADDAPIGFPEVRLGIIPAAISPYVVRRVGAGNARALFLTGRAVSGDEATRVGLVHETCPAAELDSRIDRTVRDLLAGGPEALSATKRLLDEVAAPTATDAGPRSAERIAAIRVRPEAQAGIRAFLDRAAPPWRD